MSVLRRCVFVGCVVLALVGSSHAACWLVENKPGATRCQDYEDKTWHKRGASWTNSKCAKCSCRADYISCCDGWPTSVSEGCRIKYDYRTCKYEIINHQPGTPCSAAGK